MDDDKVKYLLDYYSHLVPFEVKAKLKTPYRIKYEREALKREIAEFILKNYRDKVIFNNCPQCGRLARTPLAKQCRVCGFNWR